jgi:7-cyano-7-deazaguanine synthase in queuosine biosynthesis
VITLSLQPDNRSAGSIDSPTGLAIAKLESFEVYAISFRQGI